jgi:hypothetical protein
MRWRQGREAERTKRKIEWREQGREEEGKEVGIVERQTAG